MLKRQLLWLLFIPFFLWGITISKNTTLDRDIVYDEDVIVNGVILNLNNHSLIVKGNLNITGKNARLQMTKLNDKVIVKGNLIFNGASTYQDLTNGVIELAGDFYQKGVSTRTCYYRCSDVYDTYKKYGSNRDGSAGNAKYQTNNAYSFYPTDKHKIILNGTSKQLIHFEASNYSRFNHLEIQNHSTEGVVFEQLSIVGEWKRNNNNVKITDIRNLTLTEDYTIPNSVKIQGNNIDLNGYSLTIQGDLTVKSANLYINQGTLTVEKSLSFNEYGCRLYMTHSADKVIVKEDLTFNGASTYQDLTNGVIELAGNFYQKGENTRTCYYRCSDFYETYKKYGSNKDASSGNARYQINNAYSFYPTSQHKVLLNGVGQQIIDFEAPNSSQFANLEISNPTVDIDVSSGKKIRVEDSLYLDKSLYNSNYKDNEYITFGRYRDIHKTYMTLPRGLQLIALPIASSINESQIASIFSDENISHVLKYDSNNKRWQGFGNSETARKKIADNDVEKLTNIKAGEGFFVKTEGEVELQFPRANGYGIEKIDISSLSSGWHLLGNNKVVQIDSLLEKNGDIKVIREYQDGEDVYWSNDEDIQEEYRRRDIKKFEENNASNSGFWLYIE